MEDLVNIVFWQKLQQLDVDCTAHFRYVFEYLTLLSKVFDAF